MAIGCLCFKVSLAANKFTGKVICQWPKSDELIVVTLEQFHSFQHNEMKSQLSLVIQQMGCRESVQQGLPLLNMLVVGLSGSGKSSILSRLKGNCQEGTPHELDITSFIINKSLKVITFEVAGKAQKTWHSYYPTANIVMIVIDYSSLIQMTKRKQFRLQRSLDSTKDPQKTTNTAEKQSWPIEEQNLQDFYSSMLHQIDCAIPKASKILVVFNKIDLVNTSDAGLFQFISDLHLERLNHEACTCKCSALKDEGVTAIVKKIASFHLEIST